MIAVIVLTHNRVHLLRRCVEHVLLRTSPATSEILIWDNASEDDTRTYLAEVKDPRVKIVYHEQNVGTNAYAHAVALTSSPYIIEVDDDVIEAPHHWDEVMLDAFRKIPGIGYLVADLKEDPNDSAYCYLKHVKDKGTVFTRREVAGVRILEGPTGGGCSMTSREIYDRVGGFRQHKRLVFWHEAGAYVRDIRRHGYRTAYLEDLKVWHAGSPYYSEPSRAKIAFHDHHARVVARKDFVKRIILRIPFASALNERYRLFEPPHQYRPPDFGRALDLPQARRENS
jgi:GT2 family glycosyltransferase